MSDPYAMLSLSNSMKGSTMTQPLTRQEINILKGALMTAARLQSQFERDPIALAKTLESYDVLMDKLFAMYHESWLTEYQAEKETERGF